MFGYLEKKDNFNVHPNKWNIHNFLPSLYLLLVLPYSIHCDNYLLFPQSDTEHHRPQPSSVPSISFSALLPSTEPHSPRLSVRCCYHAGWGSLYCRAGTETKKNMQTTNVVVANWHQQRATMLMILKHLSWHHPDFSIRLISICSPTTPSCPAVHDAIFKNPQDFKFVNTDG